MSSPARATARSSMTASISACLARPLWWPWSILPPAQGTWPSPSSWSPGIPHAPKTRIPPQPQPHCPARATHLPQRAKSLWSSCAGCEWPSPSSPQWRGLWRCCGLAHTSCPWAQRGLGKQGVGTSVMGLLCAPASNPRARRRRLLVVQAVMLLPIRWLTESSSTASMPFLSQT